MADIINNIRRFLRGKSVVVRFILINVAVFFAIQLTAIAVYLADARFDLAALLVMPSDVSRLIQRPWTVVSYMFTHVDFFHILGNMLWLYCFGVIFLDLYENRAFTRVYILGGLAGAAAYCAVALFTPTASLVGASAAVLAVIAATVLRSPNYRIHLFLLGPVKIKWVGLAFVVFALFSSDITTAGSHAAHLGGLTAGCLYALNSRYRSRSRNSRGKRKGIVLQPLHAVPVNASRQELEARLDQLLDKVRASGYNALSAKERNELNEISRHIKI